MIRTLISYGLGLCALAATAGAADENHWAFQPIQRPDPPEISGARTSIDRFVHRRLAAAGLSPSPPAAPHTLLRRLHLDLTGLLPTPEETERFEKAWAASPESACEDLVDELLDSPHFGERWARPWLDLARYADSDGYLGDTMRPWAWVYRDWVIDAINRDLPFDQFSIEQLAGDLLTNATQSQKIATGFQRNNLKNTEAGADRELDRTKQVVDRVATVGTTWLGLTLACAECHDHKHDPISQKEFYRLYAIFNNSNDADIGVRLEAEWNAYQARLAAWESRLTELEAPLANLSIPPSQETIPTDPWTRLIPDQAEAAGPTLTIQEDGSILASGKTPTTITYFVEVPVKTATTITGFRLEAFGQFGSGRTRGETVGRSQQGGFVLSMFFPDLIENGKARRLKLISAEADHEDAGEGAALAETISPTNSGWRVATRTYQDHQMVFRLAEPVTLPAGSRLKFSLGQKHGTGNSLRHFRLSATGLDSVPKPLPRTVDPEFARLRLPVERHLATAPAPPPTKGQTLVERGHDDRRRSYVHLRGDYTQEGDEVEPGTPAILHPSREKNLNRLGFSQWLFEPENPLTARVAVNQIWQELFGVGLVPTSDDFGTYGEDPTHPELLDWLATEFRDSGWSRKALIRTIVLSDTYRQSSANVRPERSNELLWRQNRFRLPADLVRDVHLSASGLLSRKIGGTGIRPPLPEFVSAVGRSVKWPVSEGTERYRRGLYIVLKRTVLYPMLTTFDAPDTSASCSRRERTNTPMQALTLLNDPVFFECAEALGRDLHGQHPGDNRAALRDLIRRCLNRVPSPEEWETLASAHRDFLHASSSEEQALIATARVVMNLDEFVTRD